MPQTPDFARGIEGMHEHRFFQFGPVCSRCTRGEHDLCEGAGPFADPREDWMCRCWTCHEQFMEDMAGGYDHEKPAFDDEWAAWARGESP